MTDTMIEVSKKQELVTDLDKKITNSEYDYKEREAQAKEQLSKIINAKEEELKQLIQERNQVIQEISEFVKEKQEMETTLNYLRQKIATCKNLDFLSIEDSEKYLQLLGRKYPL